MADLTKKQIIEAERAERKAASEQAKKDLLGRANALKEEKNATTNDKPGTQSQSEARSKKQQR